jgi:hypothetical protein
MCRRKKFPDETFLNDFLGSLSPANPLKRFKWVSDELALKTVKPIKGEWVENGSLLLSFDIGIREEINGVRITLKNRGKPCKRPCEFGYGAQYSYYHYLNFYSDVSPFRFQYDCVFGSRFNKPADFRIFFPDYAFWLEVKSVPPTYSNCRYFKNQFTPYPDYVVCIKCLDEEMLNYEVYGFCTGSDVQKVKPKIGSEFLCHEIPANREHFKPYSDFHKNVLKLPYMETFDNDHYV